MNAAACWRRGGRVIIFDPYVSLTGRIVYGPLHHEPIGDDRPIVADAPPSFDPHRHSYYAAQGNATRVFWKGESPEILEGWQVIARERVGAWAYALTGGYSKPQLYPTAFYPVDERSRQDRGGHAATPGAARAGCAQARAASY